MNRFLCALAALAFLCATPASGQNPPGGITPPPGPGDTCPVCGMFIAKYPEWVATVLYRDGHADHFDGAKDMFKYLLRLDRYAPGRRLGDVAAISVTDYYGVERIDAENAFYVIGSDVYGPMGHELVPLAIEADAGEFLKDHAGERIVRFDDVTWELLVALDRRGN